MIPESNHAAYPIRIGDSLGEEGVAERYEALILRSDDPADHYPCELLHVPMAMYSGMDDDFGARLCDASKIVAHYPHPCLTDVYGFTEDFIAGGVAVVRARSHAVPLSALPFLRPMPEAAALAIVESVCDVVVHLGRARHPITKTNYNLQFRGVSASTVRLATDGSVEVVGLETLAGDWITRRAATLAIQGPLRIQLAPEQFEGSEHDTTVVFHLGLLLLELVTPPGWLAGRRFQFSPALDEAAWTEGVAEVLSQVNVRVKNDLARELLGRMLAYRPEERPTAQDLLEACTILGASLEQLAVVAASHSERFAPPPRASGTLTDEEVRVQLFGTSLRVRRARRVRGQAGGRPSAVADPSRVTQSDLPPVLGDDTMAPPHQEAAVAEVDDTVPAASPTEKPSLNDGTGPQNQSDTNPTLLKRSTHTVPPLAHPPRTPNKATLSSAFHHADTIPVSVPTELIQRSHALSEEIARRRATTPSAVPSGPFAAPTPLNHAPATPAAPSPTPAAVADHPISSNPIIMALVGAVVTLSLVCVLLVVVAAFALRSGG